MHTASVPRSAWQVSTKSSPKKCDLPDPLPPYTPLYLAGASSGSNIFAVGIFRMDNDTLNAMDQLQRPIIAVLDGLRSLAPAAVEDGIGGRDARRRRRLGIAHDANQHVQRAPGV